MHTQTHRGADASKGPEGSVPRCTVLEKEEETGAMRKRAVLNVYTVCSCDAKNFPQ